jgi:hypothetical protein
MVIIVEIAAISVNVVTTIKNKLHVDRQNHGLYVRFVQISNAPGLILK